MRREGGGDAERADQFARRIRGNAKVVARNQEIEDFERWRREFWVGSQTECVTYLQSGGEGGRSGSRGAWGPPDDQRGEPESGASRNVVKLYQLYLHGSPVHKPIPLREAIRMKFAHESPEKLTYKEV